MKIYVGNLSYNVTESDLEQKFEEFGTVTSVNILKDNQTGKPKGFGFIEMADDSEAKTAIEEMNGKDFMGREIKVDKANERPNRPRGGRGGFGGQRRGGRRPGSSGGGKRRSGGGGGNRQGGGGRNRY